ncbi:MAG: GatB/YqeY domain-containing protein [Chloroflexota bacterium]
MTDVRDEMNAALKQAMKDKNTVARNTIRMTLSAFKQVEIDDQKELTADEAMDILLKEVKKRRDTITELKEAGRDEMLAEEEEQLAVIEQFLPQQMSREEVATIVKEVIEQTGASSPKEMGKVMGALMPRVKGKADGKLVNEVVREQLQG